MKKRTRTMMQKAGAVIFTVACLFSLFLPLPKKFSRKDTYECTWSDGTMSTESYDSAYGSMAGMDGESVLLVRSGKTGRIKSGAGQVYSALTNGDLGQLLSCRPAGTRLDGAALYRTFSKHVWYSKGYFVWTGRMIKRVSRATGEMLVVLEGNITARILQETGASALYLRGDATIATDAFAESKVQSLFVEEPYEQNGGVLYRNGAGGKRLIAALSTVETLVLDEDLLFADEGALVACQRLTSLTLPFLGSTLYSSSAAYTGKFSHLFSNGKEYRVPDTLSRVRVTGGQIVAFAFYACPSVQEIDACGVDAREISAQAFLGLDGLERLHSPKRDVLLTGEFTSHEAECGCTVFERVHAQK